MQLEWSSLLTTNTNETTRFLEENSTKTDDDDDELISASDLEIKEANLILSNSVIKSI